jgi:hypothetical protein
MLFKIKRIYLEQNSIYFAKLDEDRQTFSDHDLIEFPYEVMEKEIYAISLNEPITLNVVMFGGLNVKVTRRKVLLNGKIGWILEDSLEDIND